jgi:hypothetical protein
VFNQQKKIMIRLFFLTILISLTGFSQQLKYGTGGRVYNSDNQKIKIAAVRELMKDNAVALTLYNAGREKKTWGNALFYSGFGLAAINLVTAATTSTLTVNSDGSYTTKRASPALAIVGGALVLVSIPIKIGYPKKVKAAISEYNKGIVYREELKPDVTLLANTQGLGVGIGF